MPQEINLEELAAQPAAINLEELAQPAPAIDLGTLATLPGESDTQDELDKDRPNFGQMLEAAGEIPVGAGGDFQAPNLAPGTGAAAAKQITDFFKLNTAVLTNIIGPEFLGSPFQSDERTQKQTAAVVEESGRIPSALLQQFGEVLGGVTNIKRDDNFLFTLSDVIREGTKQGHFENRDTFDDIWQGLVQTGAFAAGGKSLAGLLNMGNKGAGAIAAWLGSAVGGQAGREDAVAHGATEGQADVAYIVNSLFGATEGLPIGLALNKLDNMTGEIISSRLKGRVGELTRNSLVGLLTESLQEVTQTFGENWTARDLAQYDPGRSLSENMFEAATTGGSVGFLMSLATTALGQGRRRVRQERINEIISGTGAQDISEIAGDFVTLDEGYWEVLREIGEAEGRIAETADPGEFQQGQIEEQFDREVNNAAEMIAQTQETLEDPNLSSIAPKLKNRQRAEAGGNQAYSPEYISVMESSTFEPGQTVGESLSRTPVVSGFVMENLKSDEVLVKAERVNLQDEADVARFEEKKKLLKHLARSETQLAKELKNTYARLRTYLPKDVKILFHNDPTTQDMNHAGSASLATINGETVAMIYLDTSALMEAEAQLFREPENKIAERRRNQMRMELLSIAFHEFGHAHSFLRFGELAKKVNNGTATQKERNIIQAIRNDYMRFVAENINKPSEIAAANLFSAPRFRQTLENYLTDNDVRALAPLDQRNFERILRGNSRFQNSLPQRNNDETIDYLFSMEEYMAEEFAKMELDFGRTDEASDFFKKGFREMKKALATFKKRHRGSSGAMRDYFRIHSLRGQLREAAKRSEEATVDPLIALAKDGIIDMQTLERARTDQDKFNAFMDIGLNILQIAEQNPHIKGLQDYTKTMRLWKNVVNTELAQAEDRLTEWKNLGKAEAESLGRLLLDETLGKKPDGGWLDTPRNFTNEEIATYNLSPEALELRSQVKADFKRTLERMETILVEAKRDIFADDPVRLVKEVAQVQTEFNRLKSRPYFPLMRFGEFTLQVRARGDITWDGRKYKQDEIIEFQAFDTKQERDSALTRLRKEMGGAFKYSGSKMIQPNFSVQGMPLTLLEHLESKLESIELTDDQRKIIQEVKKDVLPFRSFRKQFQRRKKVSGFSFDAQRAYANYMTSFANHIGRVEYDREFKRNLDSVRDSIHAINLKDRGDSTKRAGILNHMNEHLNYVMNPVNEFVGLRSAAFFWFLGFNVKSAFVNLTQIPLVSYPYLAARHGDGKAVAQLTRAYKHLPIIFKKPSEVLDKELSNLIQRGIEETWLDESLATELALAASEKNLDKSLPRKARQKAAQKISHYGSYLFHKAEKANRLVTAIAAFRLAKADGKTEEGAIEEARRAVEKTQFEYARWARPKFQRGKLGGTVFVFQNYLQNALYFALGGDPGAMRMIVMLFLLAGLQGLPFGENIMDLVDASMTWLKRRAGVKDPHTAIRVDLREALKDIQVDPDLVLHGLSNSSFGLANIGEFMGWPIPDVDLSGSLSMGRVVPGTELLAPGREQTFERAVSGATERAGGAIVSGAAGIGRALFDSHPDQWKRWERAMPAAMRQVSKAARFAVRGEEATRAGYPIAGFDMTDSRDQAEIIAQGLGFTPREASKGWESFIATQQAITYYETWKSSALRQWNYSHENRDKEGVKLANAEIRKYNSSVPFPEMKIGPETRKQSYNSYLRQRKFNERRIEQSRRARRLSSSIQEVFEETDN